MVDQKKAFNLISSWDHDQGSTPLQISNTVHVKSTDVRNNIIDKIHLTPEDFMECSQVIKKINTVLDNLIYKCLSALIQNTTFANFFKW